MWRSTTDSIYLADQTTEIIDVYACQTINAITLSESVTIDTKTCKLTAWHSVVVGNIICFKQDSHFFQAKVINVSTNDITLDRPFDFAFTTSSNLVRSTNNMNVDWSVTPQIFKVTPIWTTVKFDITRIILMITDWTAMDSWTFWWIPALTNWITIRKKDWVYKNIFNSKTNWDFSLHCDIVEYDSKAPSWQYWIKILRRFSWQENNWVTIRLDPNNNDEFQIIIQDNLTWLINFNCVVQWHVIKD